MLKFSFNLINGYKLGQVKETVFLGVLLDENLYWKWKSVGIICKSSFYLDKIFVNLILFTSLSIVLLLQLSLGFDL